MGHSYNNGLHTTSKGVTYDVLRVNHLDTTTPDVLEDCKSGLVSSCAHTADTGIYTFQLSLPYPPKLVVCQPSISCAAVTSEQIAPRYKTDSYDATAGTFVVFLLDDDDAGAGVAASDAKIGSTAELHLVLAFNRYTA